MSGRGPERGVDGVPERLVHAYHDGELSGWTRWRFERRLARSPVLRRELEQIARTAAWVRAGAADPAGPDLWDSIARRLPALEAESARPASSWPGWRVWPGALAATAVLVAAIVLGWPAGERVAPEGVVRWIDSGGRDVIVLESDPDTTIIWVFGSPGAGASWRDRGTAGERSA